MAEAGLVTAVRAYEYFAVLLDYPGPGLWTALAACRHELGAEHADAAERLAAFAGECERLGEARLQEIYAETFDMRAETTLNTGYHLFGDDWKRSLFLAQLNEIYRAHGFATGAELPDHICLVLRFLSRSEGGAESDGLAADCLAPVCERLAPRLEATHNPYRHVAAALLALLPPAGIAPTVATSPFAILATEAAGGPP